MPPPGQNSCRLRRWRYLATALLLLLLSGCSLSSQEEQERLAALQLHSAAGAVAWQSRDHAAALSAYSEAHRLAPGDGEIAFRLGYLQEKHGNYSAAASAYQQGLKAAALPEPLRQDLTYRLALLAAFRLQAKDQVPLLLATLPPASAAAADLQAVLALLAGDGRQALAALNQARQYPLSQEMSSTILYHASRAYALTGDREASLQSLYEAINRAGDAPVAKDIAEFREFLQSRPRP